MRVERQSFFQSIFTHATNGVSTLAKGILLACTPVAAQAQRLPTSYCVLPHNSEDVHQIACSTHVLAQHEFLEFVENCKVRQTSQDFCTGLFNKTISYGENCELQCTLSSKGLIDQCLANTSASTVPTCSTHSVGYLGYIIPLSVLSAVIIGGIVYLKCRTNILNCLYPCCPSRFNNMKELK